MSKENKLDNRAGKTLFPPPVTPYKEYQVQIIKDVIDAILNGLNGLVIQPTATGKSTEAAFIARSCILLHGMRGIYLYDENDGLHQARKSFEYIFSKNKVKCANFFGNEKDDDVTESDIVFASFQAMNNHHEKWYKMFSKDHFDFMLVNEAHHGQAVTYKTVIEHFSCPHIGFTGTPERMDGLNILEVFDRVLAEITLVEAIVKGWVSQVEYHVLGHNLSSKKLKELVRDYTEEGKKISIKQLNESIFIDELDTEMMKKVYEYAFPEKEAKRQTKIFCENIEHANRVVAQIKKDGHNAEVAHSKMTMNHNTNALESFRRSEIQFLISVDKYNEDIDIPNIEVVVFFRTTDSKTVFFQQLGRGLRRGKPKLYVLDFVGNTQRMLILGELEAEIRKYTESDIVFDRHKINIGSLGFTLKWHGYSPDVLKLIQAIQLGKYGTWQEARDATMKLEIYSLSTYLSFYKKDPRLPSASSLEQKYVGFPGWFEFLNPGVDLIKKEFTKHGIIDYWSLKYEFGVVKLRQLRFGDLGGIKNAYIYLTKGNVNNNFSLEDVDNIANIFGWLPSFEEKIERFKIEFKKFNVTNYWELFYGIGSVKFQRISWGIFGKGKNFRKVILGESLEKNFTRVTLEKIVSKLGWELSEEEKIKEYKRQFSKYQITDYLSLTGMNLSKSADMNFGIFGGIHKFICIILGTSHPSKRVVVSDLEKVAQVFKWTCSSDEKKNRIIEELKKNNVFDYWSLMDLGVNNFKKLKFNIPSYGSGVKEFMIWVISPDPFTQKVVQTQHLEILIKKIGWEIGEEEKRLKYLSFLNKNGITDMASLMKVGIDEFRAKEFGFIGKGTAFICKVLEIESNKVKKDTMFDLGKKLKLS